MCTKGCGLSPPPTPSRPLPNPHTLPVTPPFCPPQQAEDMQQDAIDTASQAMEKFNIEKDIASYIKKECE